MWVATREQALVLYRAIGDRLGEGVFSASWARCCVSKLTHARLRHISPKHCVSLDQSTMRLSRD
jgi:hypothetical protein